MIEELTPLQLILLDGIEDIAPIKATSITIRKAQEINRLFEKSKLYEEKLSRKLDKKTRLTYTSVIESYIEYLEAPEISTTTNPSNKELNAFYKQYRTYFFDAKLSPAETKKILGGFFKFCINK